MYRSATLTSTTSVQELLGENTKRNQTNENGSFCITLNHWKSKAVNSKRVFACFLNRYKYICKTGPQPLS